MKRCLAITAALWLAGCQTLPSRSDMLETACSANPCREASRISLYDAAGTAHAFEVPAGPVFAGGVLSIVQGESHQVAVEMDGDGNAMLRWLPPGETATDSIAFRLRQIRAETGHASQLTIHNRLDRPLWMDAEQLPVNEDRFYPLTLSVVPAGRQVSRQWPHTIVEIQITGLRPASGAN